MQMSDSFSVEWRQFSAANVSVLTKTDQLQTPAPRQHERHLSTWLADFPFSLFYYWIFLDTLALLFRPNLKRQRACLRWVVDLLNVLTVEKELESFASMTEKATF